MPQLDFPLEELKKYTGITPYPSDLDDYWDKALTELNNFDWQISISQAEFQAPYAKCYDLYFTGVNGARIYAKYLKPIDNKKLHPALIEFHGYRGNSGDWSTKLKFVAAGFCVAAMDCRGQGGKSTDKIDLLGPTLEGQLIRGLLDGKDKLMYKNHFLDTVQLTRIIMNLDEVDESRIGVTGASQGGGLSLACASLEPRIKCVAPIYPFLSDYKRVWEMDMAERAYAELKTFFRLHDPLHKRESEFFNLLGYIDIKNMAHRIKAKVMMAITLMDDICPPSTQFAVFNRIESEKESLIFHDFGHENLPGISDTIFQFFVSELN